MKPFDLFQQIKDLHLNQPYFPIKDDPDIGHIKKMAAFYPNEVVYLVDCKNAVLYDLNENFEIITGCLCLDEDELLPLYNHIESSEFEHFSSFTSHLMQLLNSKPETWRLHVDQNIIIYKSNKGNILMKTTWALSKDAKGCVRWTMGRIADVSKIVPNYTFRYSFSGVSEKKIFAAFNSLQEFDPVLSKRELEILNYIGQGYSSLQISNLLFVSKHTIDTHRRNIIRKLEVSNSISAYKKALDMGLNSSE